MMMISYQELVRTFHKPRHRDKVFLPFVQDRDADAYALRNFTRGSTSVTELPDGLRPLPG